MRPTRQLLNAGLGRGVLPLDRVDVVEQRDVVLVEWVDATPGWKRARTMIVVRLGHGRGTAQFSNQPFEGGWGVIDDVSRSIDAVQSRPPTLSGSRGSSEQAAWCPAGPSPVSSNCVWWRPVTPPSSVAKWRHDAGVPCSLIATCPCRTDFALASSSASRRVDGIVEQWKVGRASLGASWLRGA